MLQGLVRLLQMGPAETVEVERIGRRVTVDLCKTAVLLLLLQQMPSVLPVWLLLVRLMLLMLQCVLVQLRGGSVRSACILLQVRRQVRYAPAKLGRVGRCPDGADRRSVCK